MEESGETTEATGALPSAGQFLWTAVLCEANKSAGAGAEGRAEDEGAGVPRFDGQLWR